jgi:cyclophilin family peptidyl-prolyl cis-trans isomerase
MSRFVRGFLHLLALAWLWPAVPARAQGDGLFAVFNTSLGSFTCYLDHVRAPRTVANFIALAEGSNAWLNLNNGQEVHSRFYDGTIFHRVVSNFVIQGGGQPVGATFRGPGYSFRDEFSPALRHNSNGILAMANSGLNTQGSQFYITATPSYSSGDDVYTIFGHVSAGSDVVQRINYVPVSSQRPLADVVLSNVTILRVGPDAEAFDCMAQGLPAVGGTEVGLTKDDTKYHVTFSQLTNSIYNAFYATNLDGAWSTTQLPFQTNAMPTNRLDVTELVTNAPSRFFQIAQVQYPDPVYTPSSVVGRSFHMLFKTSGTRFSQWLGENGTGTWSYVTTGGFTTNGAILSYSWSQSPYIGQLYVDYDTLYTMLYTYAYDVASPASNRMSQYIYFTGSTFYGTYTNGP